MKLILFININISNIVINKIKILLYYRNTYPDLEKIKTSRSGFTESKILLSEYGYSNILFSKRIRIEIISLSPRHTD